VPWWRAGGGWLQDVGVQQDRHGQAGEVGDVLHGDLEGMERSERRDGFAGSLGGQDGRDQVDLVEDVPGAFQVVFLQPGGDLVELQRYLCQQSCNSPGWGGCSSRNSDLYVFSGRGLGLIPRSVAAGTPGGLTREIPAACEGWLWWGLSNPPGVPFAA